MSTPETIAITGETPPPAHSRAGARFLKKGRKTRLQKREVDKAAEVLASKHDLPEVPGKDLKWNQAIEYLNLLTPEMWNHVAVYVYRLKPRIIRQLKDPNASNYIDCISGPFNLDYFINSHGGGTYLLQATDSEKKRPESQLFRCIFDVDMNQYEPKLNYEELDINARDNMAYVQMLQHKGILNDKGHVVTNQPQNQSAGNGGLNAEVIKEILGFVSKLTTDQQANLRTKLASDEDPLSKSIGQLMLEKLKQDDPTKQVQMLSGLLTALKEVVGTSKGNDVAPLYDRIIQMQSEHNNTVLTLIREITTQNRRENTDSSDDLDRLDKMFGIMERLQGLRGGGGGHRSGWDIGLDYAREIAVPGLQLLNNFLNAKRGGPVTPITGAPATGNAFDPYANPQALRAHAASLNTQPGAQPQTITPPITGSPELLTLLQQNAPILINALNTGMHGYEVAEHLVGLFGNVAHAQIASFGQEALLSTMMQIPEFRLFGEARVRTFLDEFIRWETFLDALDAQENQPATSAA